MEGEDKPDESFPSSSSPENVKRLGDYGHPSTSHAVLARPTEAPSTNNNGVRPGKDNCKVAACQAFCLGICTGNASPSTEESQMELHSCFSSTNSGTPQVVPTISVSQNNASSLEVDKHVDNAITTVPSNKETMTRHSTDGHSRLEISSEFVQIHSESAQVDVPNALSKANSLENRSITKGLDAGEDRKPFGIVTNQEATPSTSKSTTPRNSDSTLLPKVATCGKACASDNSPRATVSTDILNFADLTKDSNESVAWRNCDSCLVLNHHDAGMLAKSNINIADQVDVGDSESISDDSVIIVPCPFCMSIECDGFTRHTFLEPEKNPEYKESVVFSLPLPSEILTKIFSYLTPPEISRSVMPVCRQWRELANDPNLWLSLSIEHTNSVTSPYLSFLLCRATKLNDLDLSGRRLSHVDVVVWSRHCRSLQNLNLGFCSFAPDEMLQVFETIAVNCPRIKKLNVEGSQEINHKSVVIITHLSQLTDINFSHCVHLLDESINFISDNMSDLKKINIDGISWISDDAIVALVIKHKKSLKELVLDGEELTDKSVRVIGMCSHLTNLAMSFCQQLTDASLSVIKEMSQLRRLKLRNGKNFSSSALTQLFTSSQLNNLTELDLSECSELEDEGAAALLACCGCQLNALTLMWCWNLTDIFLEKIIDVCLEMRRLNLTGLHRIRGDSLSRIPDCMHHLVHLDLICCNNINDDILIEITQKMKSLTIINYYGEIVPSPYHS